MRLLFVALIGAAFTGLALLTKSPGLLLVGGSVLIVACALAALRPYLQRRHPESPPVARSAYVPLGIAVLIMLSIVYLDEYYRHSPPSDSVLVQLFLALFGHKRYFVTWPLIAVLVLGVNKAVIHLRQRYGKAGQRRGEGSSS